MNSFRSLGISEELLGIVEELGYQHATPIQSQAIPLLLEGRDIIGQAQTGTGKTAAFSLPLIQRLSDVVEVQILVLLPTRELALQVAESFKKYGGSQVEKDVVTLYGGQPISPQINDLKRGARVVVGTPGRILDHLHRQTLSLASLKALVLDEADEMLKMGFRDEVEAILREAPEERQSVLFSATIPPEIEELSTRYLRGGAQNIQVKGEARGSDHVEQSYLLVKQDHRVDAVETILETEEEGLAIVFVKTKRDSTLIADQLSARGHLVEALNGDLSQSHREAVVSRLKDARLSAIIATDVAARGLDIEHVSLVINLELPQDTEAYIHRIGRTGRGGKEGRAILLITPRDVKGLKRLERELGRKLSPFIPPSNDQILVGRVSKFKRRIASELENLGANSAAEFKKYHELIDDLTSLGVDKDEILLAALRLASEQRPLISSALPRSIEALEIQQFSKRDIPQISPKQGYQILVLHSGKARGIRPKDIVGAISHGARVDGSLVGAIRIEDERTLIELPADHIGMVTDRLNGRTICGFPAQFSLLECRDDAHVG